MSNVGPAGDISDNHKHMVSHIDIRQIYSRLRTSLRRACSSPLTYILIATFAIYTTYALTRSEQVLTAGYDLGIFDQAISAYSRFELPLVPLKGDDFNILGDHFHPILALLAPLYWIWNDARVLLIAQAALISSSCVFVWRMSTRRFGRPTATLLVIGYAFGWPLQGLVDFDFHEISFAVPLLAWAIDALDRRSDRELIIASILLVFVREDMGVLIAAIGVLRTFRRPRTTGWALLLGGSLTFIFIVTMVIPAIRGGKYGYWDYSVLGTGATDALQTILTNPGIVVADFFTPVQKTATLFALFAPLLLLPLLSPYTLIALPILGERFLSDRASLWTSEFHYNAPVWIILFMACIDTVGKAHRRFPHRSAYVPIAIATVIASVPVLASSLFATSSTETYPLARLTTGAAWVETPHMRDQRAAAAIIPASTCVVADDRIVPLLLKTNRVTVVGISTLQQDFYILDLSQPELSPVVDSDNYTQLYSTLIGNGYQAYAQFGDIAVLRSPDYLGPSEKCSK